MTSSWLSNPLSILLEWRGSANLAGKQCLLELGLHKLLKQIQNRNNAKSQNHEKKDLAKDKKVQREKWEKELGWYLEHFVVHV